MGSPCKEGRGGYAPLSASVHPRIQAETPDRLSRRTQRRTRGWGPSVPALTGGRRPRATATSRRGRSRASVSDCPPADAFKSEPCEPEHAAGYRPGRRHDVASLTKLTLRMLVRRAQTLEAEVAELDAILEPLVVATAPELVARLGIGTECVGTARRGRRQP